jgi:hypothetical protein
LAGSETPPTVRGLGAAILRDVERFLRQDVLLCTGRVQKAFAVVRKTTLSYIDSLVSVPASSDARRENRDEGEDMFGFSVSGGPAAISESEMLQVEQAIVAKGRSRAIEGPWLGLALSGGGIRSATFCLGALQKLASARLLQHFDYMSSVSGGGYIAASLHWWWTQMKGYDALDKFPYGVALTETMRRQNENLAFLRWHSSYLAPGGGISVWSGIAAILRTISISLFVWLPAATSVMLLLHVAAAALDVPLETVKNAWLSDVWKIPAPALCVTLPIVGSVPKFAYLALLLVGVLVVLFLASIVILVFISILIPPETKENQTQRTGRAARCAISGVTVGAIGLFYVYGLSRYMTNFNLNELDPISGAIFLVAGVLVVFAVVAFLIVILQLTGRLEFGVNYWFRRFLDLNATYGVALLVPLLALASLPLVSGALSQTTVTLLGFFTAVSGLASGLYGHLVQAQRIAPRYASSWAATVAGGAFLYSLVFTAYLIAQALLGVDSSCSSHSIRPIWIEVFLATLFFSILFGLMSNLNYLGLHRFYRDRLMETFLPSSLKQAAQAPKYSDADRVPISDFWDLDKANTANRPYPIMNTNVILINDDDPTVVLRGGDSFLLSPLYVGSAATKWASTKDHADQYGALSLASAMAASGAAANANAAYIGSGVTRERLISVVMMLFNLQLGLWLAAPGAKVGTPNYFSPGFKYGVLRAGYKKTSKFVELSDGGHFDNLGVYELIRRRLDVIMVLDSEEDPATSMAALASVCQRVQEDFGVTIKIDELADRLAPNSDLGYPFGAKFTAKSFFVAKIDYPAAQNPARAAKEGVFVYVKSNMIKGLSFPLRGYKAKNPDFPNQSTMDQFFEPAQFEAYRELGFVSMEALITSLHLDGATSTTLRDQLFLAV